MRKSNKKLLRSIAVPLVFILIIIGLVWVNTDKSLAPNSNNDNKANNYNGLNKSKYSVNEPSSIWVVVNKIRPLEPKSYVPTDLVTPDIPLRNSSASSEMLVRKVTAIALKKMSDQAKKESINIMLASGYRSYDLQIAVYGNYVKTEGQAGADNQSARPGFSEHQTGLAVDLEPANRNCEITDCFADTPDGKWLASNAYKFGFILRYPPNSKSIIGYKYEPWHFRYVGEELAKEMHEKKQGILEYFFGLPAAPDYK